MPLRFCANLSFMFQETSSLLERYCLAKEYGFSAVECANPYAVAKEEIVKTKVKTGVEQILINTPVGDPKIGELGFGALLGKEEQFSDGLKLSIEYAKALSCERIHIMSGTVVNPTQEHNNQYEKNLRLAARQLEKENLIGLIEPINRYSVPNYFLSDYDYAASVIQSISSPNLKLLLDVFHLQQISGNLTNRIKELLPITGHVQIAQVPSRNEPDTPGEIDYKYIFGILDKSGYDGWIGLEYKPLETTKAGLKWLKEFGF